MTGAPPRLRILATSDLHMHLSGFDYSTERSDPSVGLARLSTLIATARQQAAQDGAAVLLFDNGDGMQGTPMGDLAATPQARPHPLMQAFGYLGYDAIGLGNHDFDFGLEALGRALDAAPCPVLCANLRPGADPLPAPLHAHTVLDRTLPGGQTLRIGVLSVLPPQTGVWDRHLLAGRVGFDDMVAAAARAVAALRAEDCDLVIALAHTGPEGAGAPPPPGAENALRAIAALPGVDAVLGGHTHELQAWTRPGPPVVMPGYAGSHLGVIDLDLAQDPAGRWGVTGTAAALWPVAERDAEGQVTPLAQEDAALIRLLAPAHEATRTALRAPMGHSAYPLHSYFSFFAPDRAQALVAGAQAAALRPLLAGTEAEGLPLLSATAPSKTGGRGGPGHFTDVPAGPLQLRHLGDLYPFPNALSAVVLDTAQILDWLEQAASRFHRIAPGSRDGALIDPAQPGHGFDLLHGLSYEIDPTAPARFGPDGKRLGDGRRIRNAAWQGRPLATGQRFAVALSSYRAAGGCQVAALRGATPLPLPYLRISEALRRYLSGELPHDPLQDAPPPWRFAPLPGTGAIARTGPGARAYLDELAGRGIGDEGLDPDGFLQLRIPLG